MRANISKILGSFGLAAAVAGCGGNPYAEVGTVTYKGSDGTTQTASINHIDANHCRTMTAYSLPTKEHISPAFQEAFHECLARRVTQGACTTLSSEPSEQGCVGAGQVFARIPYHPGR